MLWISATGKGAVRPVIWMGGSALGPGPRSTPAPQVTDQVTVALTDAPAAGACQSTPQSGGLPAPAPPGAWPTRYREPSGPHAEYGVPGPVVLTENAPFAAGCAHTLTVSAPSVAVTAKAPGRPVVALTGRVWPHTYVARLT